MMYGILKEETKELIMVDKLKSVVSRRARELTQQKTHGLLRIVRVETQN